MITLQMNAQTIGTSDSDGHESDNTALQGHDNKHRTMQYP